MAKNRKISLELAWSEYVEERAWEAEDEDINYDYDYDCDDFYTEDDYERDYSDALGYWNDADDPKADYWFYLTGSYSSSYLEIWDKLEPEKEEKHLLAAKAYEDEQEDNEEMHAPAGRALRRRSAYNHKQHLKRIADVAEKAYRKRVYEDMNTGWRCKRRGGREVQFPKQLGLRSINLIQRAEKMHVA